jgi:hypothetical protein
MKLLKQRIKNNHQFFPVASFFCLSVLFSGVVVADTNKDEFPPTVVNQNNVLENTKKTATLQKSPAVPQRVKEVPQYYIPLMQGYNAYPYYYQQQRPTAVPNQRGYSAQRYMPAYPNYQSYTQQNQTMPYYGYPVAPSVAGKQTPYSNYPQRPPVYNTATANSTMNKPKYPMRQKIKKEKHAWGDERHIWPDFYTGATGDLWDKMINAPYDAGRMPGGWRAPSLSSPDPATVSDAVANQMPPIMEEMGNMTNFAN